MNSSKSHLTAKLSAKNKDISFIAFWLDIADLIGDVELPIDEYCEDLKAMTAYMDDNFNPLKQCLIDLYKTCNCKNIYSTICPIVALEVLGQRCFNLKRRKSGVDVKDVDLLEHIGIHIVTNYINTELNRTKKAQGILIRLDWYKTRKQNATLN